MVWILLSLILGFILLIKGADIMIEGASSIAKKFGVSTFFIGLTVVAFGTSAPELVISILASIDDSAGIALGNIIGSNISNTLLILGISAMIKPLVVKRSTINKEIPFSLFSIFVVGVLVNDSLISQFEPNMSDRMDGLILVLFFSIFIYYTFGVSKDKNIIQELEDDLKDDTKKFSNIKSTAMMMVGLAGLTIGGKLIVNSALSFASILQINEALVGLTLVALGTSLPELAASAIAARKGQTDMAIGNVIGSNIFNLLWVFGLSSVINPISYSSYLNVDLIFLGIATILLILLVYIGKKHILAREEGIVLIILYVMYVVFLAYRQAIMGIS